MARVLLKRPFPAAAKHAIFGQMEIRTASPSSAPSKLEPVATLARENEIRSRILYSAARRGLLPVAQVGARYYARREDVVALLTPRRLGADCR